MTNTSSTGNTLSDQSSSSDQIGHGGGWLDEAPSNFRMGLVRRIRMALVVFVTVIVAALLWWELFQPFQHTNGHLLLISGERSVIEESDPAKSAAEQDLLLSDAERTAPAADFIAEDMLAFQPLMSQLSLKRKSRGAIATGDLRELLDLRRLQNTVAEMSADSSDVLIVYLATRNRVDDGDAYIELNVRREFMNAGESRLDEFLRTLSRADASVKLLVIDAGRFESDSSKGMMLNEFPHLLEQAIAKINDPKLWVLCSNRSLEHSHVSRALERSVFGWFVVLGLKGAADFNRDRNIDLDELTRYVSTQVSEFVRQTTGGTQTQLPALIWGGGPLTPKQSLPVLLPIGRSTDAMSTDDPEQWVQSARQQSLSASVLSVSDGPLTFSPRSELASPGAAVNSRISQRVTSIVPSGLNLRGIGTINTNSSTALKAIEVPAGDQASKPPTPAAVDASTAAPADAVPTDSAGQSAANGKLPEKKSQFETKDAIELAKLFAEVWELRDELELGRTDGLNPSISAPEEWRRLVDHLLLQERLFRAARISKLFQISSIVKTIREGLRSLSRNEILAFKPGQDGRTSELVRQIHDRMNQHPVNTVLPVSFGMAELIARQTGHSIHPDLQMMIAEWDQLIEQGTEPAFQAWLAKKSPIAGGLAEMRLSRLLAAESDLGWPTKQFALRVCRVAEKTATTTLDCAMWVGSEFEEGERLRKLGERTLLDRLGHDRESEGLKWLRQALAKYEQAASNLEEIRFAGQICDRLTVRLPLYIKWHNDSCRSTGCMPQHMDIHRLADDLEQLSRKLDAPVPSQLNEIQNLSMRLVASHTKIEEQLDPIRVGRQTQTTFLPGDQLPIESALNTTLPTGTVRLHLLQKLIEIDRRNVSQVELPRVFPPLLQADSSIPVDWDWPLRTLELDLTVPRLGAVNVTGLQAELAVLSRAFQDLQKASINSSETQSPHERSNLLWGKYQSLSGGMKRFYESWGTQLMSATKSVNGSGDVKANLNQRLALRSVRRGLQLLPSQWITPDDFPNTSGLLEQNDASRLLTWHASRFERFRSGAPRQEEVEFTQLIESCRSQAAQWQPQPIVANRVSSQIAWAGPVTLSLESRPEQTQELTLNWTGAPKTPAWITVHFDPEMIDVKLDTDAPVLLYGKTSFIDPDVLPDRPATVTLSSDLPLTIRLTIRGRDNAKGNTRLIAYATTSHGTARHDLSIVLPTRTTIDLAVDGVSGSWTEADGKLRLHPFANRATGYTLGLVNREPKPRELSVKWLALRRPAQVEIPGIELSAVDMAHLLERIGPTDTLVELPEIKLADDAKPVKIPFPKPEPPLPKKPGEPILALVPHGMLVVVTGSSIEQIVDEADPDRTTAASSIRPSSGAL